MDKEKIRPGVFRRINKRISSITASKKKIKDVQERIDQLVVLKPTDKFQFHHESDLRPRLRKSMLVREFQNVEKKIICSTPHHTNNPNDEFIRKNFSVLLSPISLGRLSTEKQESVNENKNHKCIESKNDSSEIRSKQGIPNYNTTKNDDQQEIRKSLRISRRESTSNSKIDKSHNIVNQEPKNSDTSYNTRGRLQVKETGKSPPKILAKSPVKSPQVVKKTRIPVRTASQEKAKVLESNNNLQASVNQLPNQDHGKCVKAYETRLSLSKNRASETSSTNDILIPGGCKDLSPKSPHKSPKQGSKTPSVFNLSKTPNHDQTDDDDIIVISSSSSIPFDVSDGEDVEKKPNVITVQSGNQPDKSAENSNDKLDYDSNVNKTPRRRNNGILPSQDQHSAKKSASVPAVVTKTPTPSEQPEVVQNKSRASAAGCKLADKSSAVSPNMGRNKLGEAEILTNTPVEKSVAQLSPKERLVPTPLVTNADKAINTDVDPLSNLLAEITARKSAVNEVIPSPVLSGPNDKCAATPEVGNTNPPSDIGAQILSRKSVKSQECQTSLNVRRRGSGPKKKYIRLEEFRTIAPTAAVPIIGLPTPNRSNVISFGCGPCSDSNSSSGRGSNICEAAYNYMEDYGHNGQSRFQIYESLEEDDNLVDDVLNFSDSQYGEHFHLSENSNRPWRISTDDVIPQLPSSFRMPKDDSCEDRDSATFCPRNRTLVQPRNSTAGLFTEGLQRRTTLITTGRKTYNKKNPKIVEEPVNSLIQTVSSPTTKMSSNGNVSLGASSSDNIGSTNFSPRNETPPSPRDPTATLHRDPLNKAGKTKYHNKNPKIMDEPIYPLIQTVSSPTTKIPSNGKLSLGAGSSGNIGSTNFSPRNEASPSPRDSTATLQRDQLNKSGKKKYNNKNPNIVEDPINPLRPTVSSPTITRMPNNKTFSESSSDNDCRSQNAEREPSQQQSLAVGAKSPATKLLTSTNKREYREKSPEQSEEPVHQEGQAVSPSTPDRTLVSAAVIPGSDNASPRRNESVSCVSKASKRSRKDNENVPVENDTLTSSENMIVSISSADQQLLGIRPLSQVASNRTVETGKSSAGNGKRGKRVEESPKPTSSRRSIQEAPDTDSGTENQENVIEPVVERDVDRASTQRNKTMKRRARNSSDTLGLRTRCNINERNILPVIGEGRPQRTRKPMRLLSDILIDDNLLYYGKKNGRKRNNADEEKAKKPKGTKPRKGKKDDCNAENLHNDLPESGPASKSPNNFRNNDDSRAERENESESVPTNEKRARRGKSQSKTNSTKKNTRKTTTADDQNEVVEIPETIPEEDRSPLKNGFVRNNGDSIAEREKERKSVPTNEKRARRGRSQSKTNTTKRNTRNTTADDQNEVDDLPETIPEEDRGPLESDFGQNNGDSIADREKESESVPTNEKRTKRGRSQSKTNTKKKNTRKTTTADDQNEIPETSREEDRGPLESGFDVNSPLSHGEVGQPMEDESMPPPKGNTINSIYKTRTNRNLTGDSGFETMNINNTNKNFKNLSNNLTRGTSKKTKPTHRSDANVEQASQDFPPPDQPENDLLPSRNPTTEQSPSNSGTVKKQKVAKDGPREVSSAPTNSDVSRYLERTATLEPTTNMTSVDVVNNNEYISYRMDGRLYSLKFANKAPLDTEYKSYGNFAVTQTAKYKDNFSAGHVRMQAGDHKRQNVATRYSLMYSVMYGSACVQCDDKTCTVEQGGFFIIPVGTAYSIKNIDPQRELVMTYTKMKSF